VIYNNPVAVPIIAVATGTTTSPPEADNNGFTSFGMKITSWFEKQLHEFSATVTFPISKKQFAGFANTMRSQSAIYVQGLAHVGHGSCKLTISLVHLFHQTTC
jgi:hypothetical protein